MHASSGVQYCPQSIPLPSVPPTIDFSSIDESQGRVAIVTSIESSDDRRPELHEECTLTRASGKLELDDEGFDTYPGQLGKRLSFTDEEARRMEKLPALASTYHGISSYEWNDTVRTLFIGTRDENSSLSLLFGEEETLLDIVLSYLASKWASRVTLTVPAFAIGGYAGRYSDDRREILKYCERTSDYSTGIRFTTQSELFAGRELKGLVSYVPLKIIEEFPKPNDRNVNMLPFIFGVEKSLPKDLQCYYDLIEELPYCDDEVGKVGYLTVHESYVAANVAQRREGLHIETPGVFSSEDSALFVPGHEYHRWGRGHFVGSDRMEGGIFMASTVADTSEVWDALVHSSAKGIVDCHGGCEHLRPLLGPGRRLKENELIWMTDCTPHEALPQKEAGYRQFFRVVTSDISHWFADHSTPNPLVPLPDNVAVVHGSKFRMG